MLKLKKRYLSLVCLLLCIPVLMGLSCATAQSRDGSEDEITRIIGQWQEEYQNSEGWLFSARHVDAPEVHGIPGDNVISHLDALRIALGYIVENHPELSLDDLAQKNYPFFLLSSRHLAPSVANRLDAGKACGWRRHVHLLHERGKRRNPSRDLRPGKRLTAPHMSPGS